jgi:hypothetical protein
LGCFLDDRAELASQLLDNWRIVCDKSTGMAGRAELPRKCQLHRPAFRAHIFGACAAGSSVLVRAPVSENKRFFLDRKAEFH